MTKLRRAHRRQAPIVLPADGGPTLNQALAYRGYEALPLVYYRRTPRGLVTERVSGRRAVARGGVIKRIGAAHEHWDWLRNLENRIELGKVAS